MSGSILSAITIIGSIILALIKAWGDGAPQRKQEKMDEEIQEGRAAIAGGDVGAVSQRIDRVLTVQTGAAPSGASGIGTGAPLQGDADTLRRLAALGVISGQTSGKGGEL